MRWPLKTLLPLFFVGVPFSPVFFCVHFHRLLLFSKRELLSILRSGSTFLSTSSSSFFLSWRCWWQYHGCSFHKTFFFSLGHALLQEQFGCISSFSSTFGMLQSSVLLLTWVFLFYQAYPFVHCQRSLVGHVVRSVHCFSPLFPSFPMIGIGQPHLVVSCQSRTGTIPPLRWPFSSIHVCQLVGYPHTTFWGGRFCLFFFLFSGPFVLNVGRHAPTFAVCFFFRFPPIPALVRPNRLTPKYYCFMLTFFLFSDIQVLRAVGGRSKVFSQANPPLSRREMSNPTMMRLNEKGFRSSRKPLSFPFISR